MIKTKIKYGLMGVLLFVFSQTFAQQYTNYDLKAAYIFNFTKFIEWPNDAFQTNDSEFVITVLGDCPIAPILNEVFQNKTIFGRKVFIQTVYDIENTEGAHIIFISQKFKNRYKSLITEINHSPTLTVGDMINDFCLEGGMVNLTRKTADHSFEINPKAAEKSRLKISSKLLTLSRIIRK